MFAFDVSPFAVPATIRTMAQATWQDLAEPGTIWTGTQRVAIASIARAARLGATAPSDAPLPDAAVEAATLLGATPAVTSRSWVDRIVGVVGERAYVELVGIASRVIAIDTFTRMLGCEPEPLPAPHAGDPVPTPAPEKARKSKTWVTIKGLPVPPNVLSLVPAAKDATNRTESALYMTGDDMAHPDIVIDGLHRTQIEIVATAVSHRNECFY